MKKLNNKGLTLIELLVAMTVLAIFMVTVTAFITTTTSSTKKTKRQIAVERMAQEVYDDIYDSVVQATCLIVKTDSVAGETTTPEDTSDESSDSAEDSTEESTEEASDTTKLTYQTTGFESALSASEKSAFLISKNAYMSTVYAKSGSAMSADTFKDFADESNLNVSKPMNFKRDGLGKWKSLSRNMSWAQYTTTKGVLDGKIGEYAVFDSRTYNVSAIALGPVSFNAATKSKPLYNTLVYLPPKKDVDGKVICTGEIFLNRGDDPDLDALNFATDKNYMIADHCEKFEIQVMPDKSAVKINMTFKDGGYGYTVGGTINLRNLNILE